MSLAGGVVVGVSSMSVVVAASLVLLEDIVAVGVAGMVLIWPSPTQALFFNCFIFG
jgi:hypothetical protein